MVIWKLQVSGDLYSTSLIVDIRQGSLRCDINVSVNPVGKPLGTRCEIKNLNSVKFMQTAISQCFYFIFVFGS
jgi:Asp-tRNA(Asn)/Glu-tRNA(Gln) amidotransferase B subunit